MEIEGNLQNTKEDIAYRKQIVEEYRPDVQRLIRYIPWLMEKAGKSVSETFEGSGIKEHSVTFPVYDGTLMSFVKDVQRTKLLDCNYVYVYSRNQIHSAEDEKRLIDRCGITQMHTLGGILSKYIMGGMTKGRLWSEGVQNGVLLAVVEKMKENIEFWDKPMA